MYIHIYILFAVVLKNSYSNISFSTWSNSTSCRSKFEIPECFLPKIEAYNHWRFLRSVTFLELQSACLSFFLFINLSICSYFTSLCIYELQMFSKLRALNWLTNEIGVFHNHHNKATLLRNYHEILEYFLICLISNSLLHS